MDNKKIIIIGYSGHSYCCIEVAVSLGFSIIGYCDIEEKKINPYNLKYLGREDKIQIIHKPFIAIGNNFIRRNIYDKLNSNNIILETTLIHSKSIISKSSLIEKQTFISAGVIVNSLAKISQACIINTGAIIEHECCIGGYTHIGPGAVLAGNVSVGKECFIGANSVIKQGVTIGDNVIVGAGSVVLKNISSNAVFVGNPAKKIK